MVGASVTFLSKRRDSDVQTGDNDFSSIRLEDRGDGQGVDDTRLSEGNAEIPPEQDHLA
jgi:hypothetical protein